jgi:hypothetical protein
MSRTPDLLRRRGVKKPVKGWERCFRWREMPPAKPQKGAVSELRQNLGAISKIIEITGGPWADRTDGLFHAMECIKPQIIDGTSLTSRRSRKTGIIGAICGQNAGNITTRGQWADPCGSAQTLSFPAPRQLSDTRPPWARNRRVTSVRVSTNPQPQRTAENQNASERVPAIALNRSTAPQTSATSRNSIWPWSLRLGLRS